MPEHAPESGQSSCDIWLVNHYAGAPDRPTGSRHFDFGRLLARRGRSVTIFSAGFDHVSGREERLQWWQLYRIGRIEGVTFVWLRTVPYRGNSWRRQLNMLSFLVAFLVVQTRFSEPDIVIGSTVHPFAALGAWAAARSRGARYLFEVRDLWPRTLVDLGALRSGSAGERLLNAMESFLVRRASNVITLLPGIRDYLRERGLPVGHVVYLPNGVDLDAFDAASVVRAPVVGPASDAIATIRRYRDQGRVVFGYVGAFGRVNRVDLLVRAAAEADARAPGRVGLVLVGDGPERPSVEREALATSAVAVCAAIPKWSVPSVLGALDGAVVHATATPVYRYGISFNKLFEYMAAGLPVAFACSSAYDPVATTGAGISIEPDDVGSMATALLSLADAGLAERARMGAAGRAFVELEHDLARLATTLDELVGCDRAFA